MTTKKETLKKNSSNSKGIKIPTIQTQSQMKTNEIRDLIDFIAHSGLNEVEIETKELKLYVKREPAQKIIQSSASSPVLSIEHPVAPPVPIAAPSPIAIPSQEPPITASKPEKSTSKPMLEIKSPMIGTFYLTANPDSPPYVSVGDKITKGQTVCIVEAMKLFNEIESEVSGTVVKVLVENASPVEYDQVLFLIEPA